ncbi:MAG TPA: P-II family nitrogen regulator [Dehalococcoidia bacterium]|nr:P-II family nitrogen regulator [Dehalococcoidia bacterium]
MKKIDAVIREGQLPIVLAALADVGYPGITLTTVKGHGRQKGVKERYRGVEFTVDFLPKVKIELIVDDAAAGKIVTTIAEHARTGAVGDGKIWVTPVDSVMRVRTGETGEAAI